MKPPRPGGVSKRGARYNDSAPPRDRRAIVFVLAGALVIAPGCAGDTDIGPLPTVELTGVFGESGVVEFGNVGDVAMLDDGSIVVLNGVNERIVVLDPSTAEPSASWGEGATRSVAHYNLGRLAEERGDETTALEHYRALLLRMERADTRIPQLEWARRYVADYVGGRGG